MGTETRIGILTGLVIVVVASVYFFYGSESPDEEFLIATGNEISQPPTIPLSSEQKALSPNTGGKADASRRTGQRVAMQPDAQKPDAQAQTPSAHSRQRKVPPRRLADARRTNGDNGPTRRTTPAARRSSPDAPRTGAGGSTPLRTGPSQDLIDATRKNIEEANERESGEQVALADDDASGKSDIARIVERLRKNRAASTPDENSTAKRTDDRGSQAASGSDRGSPSTGQKREGANPLAPDQRKSSLQPAAPKKHKIVRNDTIEKIALKYYNDRGRVDEIMKANPGIDPRRLKIGDEIILPATTTSSDRTAAADRIAAKDRAETAVSTRSHTVREDESFYSIARSQLGSGARWKELFELNRALVKNDPRGLKPGMVLRLPN
jgi:nucleoid-associated protein YgaU